MSFFCCSQRPAFYQARQGTDIASGAAAAGIIVSSLSDEADALMAPWAYQVAAMKKHDDSLVVNAHGAEVLIVFQTAVLGFHIVCASCNLQQHVASYLHDLESDLKMYPSEGDQLAVSCQMALGSLQRPARTHSPGICIDTS